MPAVRVRLPPPSLFKACQPFYFLSFLERRKEKGGLILRVYFKRLERKVKGMKANGGDLGTQRRRRAQIPAKRFGELAASFDPKIPE